MSSQGSNALSGVDLNNVPELILALCKHLSRNDPVLVSKLYKNASFIINSSSYTTEPTEEFLIANAMRKLLPSENLQKFELQYITICKTNILKQRASVLSLLLSLAEKPNDPMKSTSTFDVSSVSQTNLNTKSQGDSKDSLVSTILSKDSLGPNEPLVKDTKRNNVLQCPAKPTMSQATSLLSTDVWSHETIPLTSKLECFHPISESELLQGIIYALQGIESKYIKKEVGSTGFVVDYKAGKSLTAVQKGLVDRLLGTSFLYSQLKQYCEENHKQSGIICQAVVTALRVELCEYYRTLAILRANMPDMTMRKAIYIMFDHHQKFEWLAYMAEQCSDKKGGAIISAIHGFLQHGSPTVQEAATKLLTAVCKPLYTMLSRWLLDGEINDPFNEFFIEIKSISNAEELWDNKYFVRKSMVPSFIHMNQAHKILATGKSINFLRQICKDSGQLPGRESLQKLFKTTTAEALFAPEQNLDFHETLEDVYRETSLRVLDLLKYKFKLYQHLQSLRRYLLLGQGDFIRHLIELLDPELSKNASDIYGHTLSGILESAIRVTNAQYEDVDTLRRLVVNFGGSSHGDKGWDVFSLCYVIDGPVGTIFQQTLPTYKALFGALWKAKRMEFVLANMRKQQITMAKLFKKLKDLRVVTHRIHILTGEMIHFLHQTQYYFLFEVLECSWADMLNQLEKAEGLDDVIIAHRTFLNSVKKGVLLEPEYREIFMELNSIYTLIVEFETYQSSLYVASLKEHKAYTEYCEKRDSTENFGLTQDDERKETQRRMAFQAYLKNIKYNVISVSDRYTTCIQKYLNLLSSSSNMNLQLLSVRLSFNDYYRVT